MAKSRRHGMFGVLKRRYPLDWQCEVQARLWAGTPVKSVDGQK